MLARLVQHCVDELATDGDAGAPPARLFEFVDAFWAHEPADARPTLDAPYREFVWRLVADRVCVGRGDGGAAPPAAAAARQRILERGRHDVGGAAAPTPLAAADARLPLATLERRFGAALRVYVPRAVVARVLTGAEAPALSPAAYWVLQLVCRARAAGITVVQLGAATQYDQKTVFYLVKTLVERELVAKFAAHEAGHPGNLCVARRFLHLNPQWRAQQSAAGADAAGAAPVPVDVADLEAAARDDAADDDAADDALPPDGTSLLAFPLLSDEQTSVWLHSRTDLLTERLVRMLRASPAHMTPRRFLPVRLGLRSVRTLRRAFIAYMGRLTADGIVERVRVQAGTQRPLYVRATPKGLAWGADAPLPPAAPPHAAPEWTAVRETPLERQLLAHIDACGAAGATMHDLAATFHASADVKRMIETILVRATLAPGTPAAPLRLCAPFEQEGRERRIRYYTLAGFEARCAREGLEPASTLGFAPLAAPRTLPGETQFTHADALATALAGVRAGTTAFFRDAAGPIGVAEERGLSLIHI